MAVDKVIRWFTQNQLKINVTKSCVCVIGTRQRRAIKSDLSVIINIYNEPVPIVDSFNYIGVTIDNSLSWKQHVNILSSSLGRRVGILARLRHILPQHCLATIYNTTIQPLIDYGLSVWGHSSAYNINLIQRYQNRAACLVSSNFNYDESSLNIVKRLKWLNVKERCIYFTNLLTYKCMNNAAPCYLTTLLSCRANINSHSTRQTSNLDFNVPKHGIEKFKESYPYQAPSLWNNLSISIRNAISIQSFKSLLKMYLMSSSGYNLK